PVVFRHVADARPHFDRTPGHVEPEDPEASACRCDEAEQCLEEGALARPVRPEQAHGAARQRTRETMEHTAPAVVHDHLFELDCCVHTGARASAYTTKPPRQFAAVTRASIHPAEWTAKPVR